MTDQSRKVLKEELASYYGLSDRADKLIDNCMSLSGSALAFERMLNNPEITRGEKVHITGQLMRDIAKVCVTIEQVLYLLGYDKEELLLRLADREYEVAVKKIRAEKAEKERGTN